MVCLFDVLFSRRGSENPTEAVTHRRMHREEGQTQKPSSVTVATPPPPASFHSVTQKTLAGPGTQRGDLLIAVRKGEPPISLEDAFFLKQGIDFHQDTQASNEATYVNLEEAPLIHCQEHLSPWLGAATALI